MTIEAAVSHFLALRTHGHLVGRSDLDPSFFMAQHASDDETVHIFDVRTVSGDTLTVQIGGSPCILIDAMATETALELFDLVEVYRDPSQVPTELVEAMDQKRLARGLFATGSTAEAYVLATLIELPDFQLDQAHTPVTSQIAPDRRRRFVDRFSAYSLCHELAHLCQDRLPDLVERYRACVVAIAQEKGVFFAPDDFTEALAKLEEIRFDPEMRETIRSFAATGELDKYYAISAEELLADATFVEEIICDLMSVDALFDRGVDALHETAEDLVLASLATYFTRHQLISQQVLEYMRDAASLEVEREQIFEGLRQLNARGGAFSDGDTSRFLAVQQFQVRAAVVARHIIERVLEKSPEQEQAAAALSDDFIRIGALVIRSVGPINGWGHEHIQIAMAGGALFKKKLREKGYEERVIEAEVRSAFLKLYGF